MDADKRTRLAPAATPANQDDALHTPAPGRGPATSRINGGAGTVQFKAASPIAVRAGAQVQRRTDRDWVEDANTDAALRGRSMPVQATGDLGGAESVQDIAARGVSGAGSQLPHLQSIQQAFGSEHDVSSIQAHVGGPAAQASDAIGANAYATGNDVAFESAPDLHTAAHEAAHIVQQRQGVQLAGGVGQVGDAYEQHADAVADRVASGRSASDLLEAGPGGGSSAAPVQKRSKEGVTDGVVSLAQAVLAFLAEGNERTRGKLASRLKTMANLAGTEHPAGKRLVSWVKNKDLEAIYQDAGKSAQLREFASEVLAEKNESVDGGHSLDRHGPEVSDDLLKRRLETGIAPDGAESPAPGMSTRFSDYTLWLETRTAAVADLNNKLLQTQTDLIRLLPPLDEAKGEVTLAEWEVRGPQEKVNEATSKVRHKQEQYNRAQRRLDKVPSGMNQQQFEQVRLDSLNKMKTEEKTAKNELREPATRLRDAQQQENTARQAIRGINRGVALNFNDNAEYSADFAVLRNYYTVTLDHGKTIGEGFEGTVAKAKNDARQEAQDAGHNVVAQKIDTDQATLYDTVQAVNGLTKTATGLQPPSDDMALVEGAMGKYTPVTLNVASWRVVQHFPAAANANVGVA